MWDCSTTTQPQETTLILPRKLSYGCLPTSLLGTVLIYPASPFILLMSFWKAWLSPDCFTAGHVEILSICATIQIQVRGTHKCDSSLLMHLGLRAAFCTTTTKNTGTCILAPANLGIDVGHPRSALQAVHYIVQFTSILRHCTPPQPNHHFCRAHKQQQHNDCFGECWTAKELPPKNP